MRSRKRLTAALCGIVLFGIVLPAFLAIGLVPSTVRRMESVQTVAEAIALFRKDGFDPQAALADGIGEIPPIFVSRLPRDLGSVSDPRLRKAVFVSIVLPQVLLANARIRADRARLSRLVAVMSKGGMLLQRDRRWLARLARRYGTRPGDVKALLRRVDIVPPRLAVAQAAQESGWGTSRFARAANALFGQHVDEDAESAVAARKADGVALHAFDTIYDSVRSYIHNLNTYPAYRAFRDMRARMRGRGETLDADRLVGTLEPYSEQGATYVARLLDLMQTPPVAASKDIRLATAD